MRISDWSSDVCSSDLPSVASLRQRLGRSGRRKGEPAILRGYCVEYAINERASLDQMLRLHTVQTVAMISLLLEGWFEPPAVNGQHLSTLVMQMRSEEHTSELQSLMRISYAVFCLKKNSE